MGLLNKWNYRIGKKVIDHSIITLHRKLISDDIIYPYAMLIIFLSKWKAIMKGRFLPLPTQRKRVKLIGSRLSVCLICQEGFPKNFWHRKEPLHICHRSLRYIILNLGYIRPSVTDWFERIFRIFFFKIFFFKDFNIFISVKK